MPKNGTEATSVVSLGACDDCLHSVRKCFNAIAYDEDGNSLVKCDKATLDEVDECGRVRARVDITSACECERADVYQKARQRKQRKMAAQARVA